MRYETKDDDDDDKEEEAKNGDPSHDTTLLVLHIIYIKFAITSNFNVHATFHFPTIIVRKDK